jgi:hypothetical protein
MFKIIHILAAGLFVWGLVLAPVGHGIAEAQGACVHGACPSENHSPAEPAPHDANHCAICQLAHAPLLAAAPVILSVPETSPVAVPDASFHAPAVSAGYRLPFSCGPPT